MGQYSAPYFTEPATPYPRRQPAVPGWRRMLFILASITVVIMLLLAIRPRPAARQAGGVTQQSAGTGAANVSQGLETAGSIISPIFAPAVQYWAPQIGVWAEEFGLDPNLVATIMQVESCGDPAAISSAGAQGLFQVMPFHFQEGENSLDPDTNARRGLAYFVERLAQTSGEVGRALAGYNGGHVAAGSSWDNWLPETQRYYVWTTGIYGEIQQGTADSGTLQRWMQGGGSSLCQQAAQRLGLN